MPWIAVGESPSAKLVDLAAAARDTVTHSEAGTDYAGRLSDLAILTKLETVHLPASALWSSKPGIRLVLVWIGA